MANKVIVPQKINYVPNFLKQRDINTVVTVIYVQYTIYMAYLVVGAVADSKLIKVRERVCRVDYADYSFN